MRNEPPKCKKCRESEKSYQHDSILGSNPEYHAFEPSTEPSPTEPSGFDFSLPTLGEYLPILEPSQVGPDTVVNIEDSEAKILQISDEYTGSWYDVAYARCVTVMMDNTGAGAPISNVLVTVTITPDSFDYAQADPTGSDVVFVDSDNTTLLISYIESWDYGGTSTFVVLIPTYTATEYTIYCYWGA